MSNESKISTVGFVNPTGAVSPFARKNANRKAHAAHSPRHEALEARNLRRQVGGAFGNEDKSVFNVLVVGTTGTPR